MYLYTYGLIRTHNVSINNAELKFQDRNYLSKAVDILRNRFNITTTLSNFYQKAHDLLYHYGYSPPIDMLRRLSGSKESITKWIPSIHKILSVEPFQRFSPDQLDGLIIYFIRARAQHLDLLNEIINYFDNSSLEIVCQFDISHINSISREIRGGFWFDSNGQLLNGYPYHLVICYDRQREPLTRDQLQFSLPFVRYQSYFIKDKLRHHLQDIHPTEASLNVFHSTDDAFEVMYTLSLLPRKLQEFASMAFLRSLDK